MEKEIEHIKKVLEKYSPKLYEIDGVVMVGIGYKEVKGNKTETPCLIVFVKKKLSAYELKEKNIPVIPGNIEGVITDVKEVGEISICDAYGYR